MNNAPFFSIIVPCKNEELYIVDTIGSIQDQSFSNYEIIVVDGESTDGTIDVLDKLKREDSRILVYSDKDDGVFDAMNRGLKHSSGEYVFFLNAKDRFYKADVLEHVHKVINDILPDILVGDYSQDRIDIQRIVRIELNDEFYRNLRHHWGICHQAVFARRNLLCNGFDLKYRFAADFDWFCRQISSGVSVSKADIILTYYDAYGMSSMLYNKMLVDMECYDISKHYFDDYADLWRNNSFDVGYYKINKSKDILKKQYDLLNFLFYLYQRKYDFTDWFNVHGIKTVAIYGMDHIGKRLYDYMIESYVEIIFVSDIKDLSNQYFEYISPNNRFFPDVDAVIITPIIEFHDIKKKLQDMFKGRIPQMIPIELLVAELKRNYSRKLTNTRRWDV